MQSKAKILLTVGTACSFLTISSLAGFTGWYQAIKVSTASATLSSSEDVDTVSLSPVQEKTWENVLAKTQLDAYEDNLQYNQTIALNFAEPFIIEAPKLQGEAAALKLPDIDKDAVLQRYTTAVLKKGDDLISMFVGAGLTNSQAWNVVDTMKPHASPNKMPAGKKFQLEWDFDDDREKTIKNISFVVDEKSNLVIKKLDDKFQAKLNQRETVEKILRGDVVVANSLYGDGAKAGIPNSILSKMLKIYSWDVDFSREVKQDDKFSLLYTCEFDKATGEKLNCDNILYASIDLSKSKKELFSFTHSDGNVKYYSNNGLAAEKKFLKTPIDISKARISSRVGTRFHPISKRQKMHNGVDFAAPTGTKIYAAADGKIIKRERSRSAGNLIEINHGDYITVYMHQSRFEKGLSVGSRVRQGQIIGYVGSTGYSTGPHLHYELRKASNRGVLDPLKVSPISNNGVSKAEFDKFEEQKRKLKSIYASIQPNIYLKPEEILAQINSGTFVSAKARLEGAKGVAPSLVSQGLSSLSIELKEKPEAL